MKLCKTCAHWGNGKGDSGRLRQCTRKLYGYHIYEDEVADNQAVVENDEGWGMETGPYFGCVLHEVKA